MPKHYKSAMIDHVKSIFTKITEQDEQLGKHELALKENAEQIKGVDKRVGDLEKIANSQLIWRIEDYTRKLKEAKAGNGDTLFSPTFTTSKHGYRLCASVCLNGDGKGKGTHMSVFISVLKGRTFVKQAKGFTALHARLLGTFEFRCIPARLDAIPCTSSKQKSHLN